MRVQLSVQRLSSHVQELAKAFDVTIFLDPLATTRDAANYSGFLPGVGRVLNAVHVPLVTDEESYVCALHELGHAVDPMGQLRTQPHLMDNLNLKLEEEQAAWRWAKHYALVWTVRMQQSMDYAYGTHVEAVRLELERRRALIVRPRKTGTLSSFLKDIT